MTSLSDLPPIKVDIKSEKKKVKLILETKTDSFAVCESKIIEKPKIFGLAKKQLIVHRIEGEEGWEIKVI